MNDEALSGQVIESAAAALSAHFKTPVQVIGQDLIRDGRSKVARLQLAGAPVGSTIVKLAGDNRALWCNEYAGLAFLSGLPRPPSVVPGFQGGDRELGLVLIEDFGAEHSLADVLLHSDAQTARRAMFGYVDALLGVHLPTFGRGEEYAKLRASLSEDDGGMTQTLGKTWELLTERLAELDKTLDPSQAEPAKQWIAAVLEADSSWHAFTVNDCCPDNNQVAADGRVRLFDLEFCHVRHALIDLAYVRTTMPTCWCLRRFPEGLDAELVAHYRDRLLAERPELTREGFDSGLAAAEAYLALVNLSWHIDRATQPGGAETAYFEEKDFHIPSRRQMVLLRLDELARTTSRQPELAPLGSLAARIKEAARQAWGPVEPLPLYPAFSRT
ncbi:aminoglycoside phosphotransferase family protein [Flindersiella endophytica]